MPLDTDMHNALMHVAVLDDRVKRMGEELGALGERMDEKLDSLKELHNERSEVARLTLQATIHVAVESAMKQHVAPLAERVQKLETAQLESKVVFATAAKGAALVGGSISVVWGIIQAWLQ